MDTIEQIEADIKELRKELRVADYEQKALLQLDLAQLVQKRDALKAQQQVEHV